MDVAHFLVVHRQDREPLDRGNTHRVNCAQLDEFNVFPFFYLFTTTLTWGIHMSVEFFPRGHARALSALRCTLAHRDRLQRLRATSRASTLNITDCPETQTPIIYGRNATLPSPSFSASLYHQRLQELKLGGSHRSRSVPGSGDEDYAVPDVFNIRPRD